MIRLRGHHLICLHFFKGEGYPPEFVAYLGSILERAAQGEQIEVVSGPDDVCEKCHFLKVGRCLFNANADEEIRKMDEAAVLLQRTKKNEVVSWRDMRENLPLVFNSWFKKYCGVCEWRQSCEKEEEFRSMSDMGAP